jgi:hypothetical protein
MEQRKIKLLCPTPMQQRMLDESRRFNVACCGRRAGKSELGIHLAVTEALKGRYVAFAGPVYSQILDPWRKVLNILQPVVAERNIEQKFLRLENNGTIEFFSMDGGSADVIRGKRFSLVIVDEAAQIADLEDIFWAVLRPTLTDLSGNCWMLSTPNGLNAFFRFWTLGADPLNTEWQSWKLPTTSNPFIDPKEIEAARKAMPQWRFAAEYLGEFIDSGSGIFRYVDEAIRSNLPIAKPVRGHSYVIGCDVGRVNDFTCISVIDEQERSLAFLDRFTNLDFSMQIERLKAIVDRFKPALTLVEANNFGIAFIEGCRKSEMRITPFVTTNATKSAAIESLSAAFEQRSIAIPNDPTLLSELRSFTVSTTSTGLSRYAAPIGQHDDCVLSLAIAWAGVAGLVERPRTPKAFWLEGWQPEGGETPIPAELKLERRVLSRSQTDWMKGQ